MEIALFSFLLVLTAYRYQGLLASQEGLGKLIFSATLLALTRPEGALIAILLTLLVGFQFCVRLWPKENLKPIRWPLLFFPLGVFLAQTGLFWLLTGQAASSGYLAKSEFVSVFPFIEPQFMAGCRRFWEILLFLLGLKSGQQDNLLYLLPGTLVFFLVGTIVFWGKRFESHFLRSPFPWMIMSVLGVAMLVATLFCSNLHHWRYLLPLFPWLLLGMAGGLWKISGLFGRQRLGRLRCSNGNRVLLWNLSMVGLGEHFRGRMWRSLQETYAIGSLYSKPSSPGRKNSNQ